MPDEMKVVDKLPSDILEEIGFCQAGFYAVNEMEEEVDWDAHDVDAVCMIGAAMRAFNVKQATFRGHELVLSEQYGGMTSYAYVRILEQDYPEVYLYLHTLADEIRKLDSSEFKGGWEKHGWMRIGDHKEIVNDISLIAGISDLLLEPSRAYVIMMDCEKQLGFR